MTPIESLRNLGPRSSQWLRDAGITTVADLQQLGVVAAFRVVKDQHAEVSLNLLWAMSAGLEGIDWRELPESTKRRLRKELERL